MRYDYQMTEPASTHHHSSHSDPGWDRLIPVSRCQGGGYSSNTMAKSWRFRDGSMVFVIDNACPHAGGSLGQRSPRVVTCPWHQWQFALATGVASTPPPPGSYPARILDGWVEIQLPHPRR
jgi:nitrite reductase/ring-hydroxylating ferredoxin subunit